MISVKFLLPSAYGVLDACCKGKERSLIHQTLLRFLTVGGTLEWVLVVLGWWCSEDRLHAKLSRTYTYSFFFCFFCSLIGVLVSPIPILKVMGA